jgi:hypothetical protein
VPTCSCSFLRCRAREYACCAPPAAVRSTPPVCRRGWQTGRHPAPHGVLALAARHMPPRSGCGAARTWATACAHQNMLEPCLVCVSKAPQPTPPVTAAYSAMTAELRTTWQVWPERRLQSAAACAECRAASAMSKRRSAAELHLSLRRLLHSLRSPPSWRNTWSVYTLDKDHSLPAALDRFVL